MTLPSGHYRTQHGSEMWISGKYAGISEVAFDWLEEEHACCDCVPSAYEQDGDMVWSCTECGGGRAKLIEQWTPEGHIDGGGTWVPL